MLIVIYAPVVFCCSFSSVGTITTCCMVRCELHSVYYLHFLSIWSFQVIYMKEWIDFENPEHIWLAAICFRIKIQKQWQI
jgi:hypothetical protein